MQISRVISATPGNRCNMVYMVLSLLWTVAQLLCAVHTSSILGVPNVDDVRKTKVAICPFKLRPPVPGSKRMGLFPLRVIFVAPCFVRLADVVFILFVPAASIFMSRIFGPPSLIVPSLFVWIPLPPLSPVLATTRVTIAVVVVRRKRITAFGAIFHSSDSKRPLSKTIPKRGLRYFPQPHPVVSPQLPHV